MRISFGIKARSAAKWIHHFGIGSSSKKVQEIAYRRENKERLGNRCNQILPLLNPETQLNHLLDLE